jgi:hypothetical protein
VSPVWTLQRPHFEPDVAAETSDRGENRDPGKATKRTKQAIDKGDAIRERPPPRKMFLQCFDQIDCVHMFGLLVRSRLNAGQDGFRDTSSKQKCDLT